MGVSSAHRRHTRSAFFAVINGLFFSRLPWAFWHTHLCWWPTLWQSTTAGEAFFHLHVLSTDLYGIFGRSCKYTLYPQGGAQGAIRFSIWWFDLQFRLGWKSKLKHVKSGWFQKNSIGTGTICVSGILGTVVTLHSDWWCCWIAFSAWLSDFLLALPSLSPGCTAGITWALRYGHPDHPKHTIYNRLKVN